MRNLLVLGFAAAISACDTPKDTPKSANPVRPTGPPVVTNSLEIATLYNTNEIAADLKFKGKLIRLTGWVGAVTRNSQGEVIVTIVSNAPGVRPVLLAILAGEDAKAAKLQHMAQVEIEAIGDGHHMGNPTLIGGRILP